MSRKTKPDKRAVFIAALTATDQLGEATDASVRREDNKDHWRAMQRLGFLAEAAHLRARAAYQDDLVLMYETTLAGMPEDLITRLTAVRVLRAAVDRYVAFPARTKTQASERAANLKRWQHNVVGGFELEDVLAWKAHAKRWADAIAAERARFSGPGPRQIGEPL